ncbi:hypothetical protein [Streptomyces hirsutus]|uniref:hypothetical protein n=1 Tax=Streptomyces hirsutus TaxID=35620 RepID=UPI0006E44E65|nr:hypothetical protein [Streptomyces hirsutus]
MRRVLTIGCLVLLVAPIVLVAFLWYSFWQAGQENDRRRQTASDSLLRQARDAADRTTDALTASRDTGTDALLDMIWKYTESPVITYDEDRRVFTAVASRSAKYDPAEPVLFGDRGEVKHCFGYTYAHRPGPAWTSEVTERDREACGGSDMIGGRLGSARMEMERLDAGRLTRPGLQDALDLGRLPREESRSEVRGVVRKGRTAVALVLFRERYWSPDEGSAVAEQCYRLTRFLDGDSLDGDVGRSVTATPVAAAC